MNRYPVWKYVIIGLALAVGLLYALPNLFPEVPAVQVSSSKTGIRIDSALLANVEETLKGANIAFRGDALDPTGIKVRFNDPDTQLKAKDVLQQKLGEQYAAIEIANGVEIHVQRSAVAQLLPKGTIKTL